MPNQRRNRISKIIIGQLSVAIFIILVSVTLIFYSQGLRINFKNFKIYKTGLIYLMVNPVPDKIFIGDKEYNGKNEFYSNLVPGDYRVKVTKDGFVDCNYAVEIKPEVVTSYGNVVLFKNNPVISDLVDQSKIDYLNSPDSSLVENARNKLAYNKYEIWMNNNLITRFSEPINNVSWYPDYAHIVYQKANQIRVIDEDGFNDTELVNLTSNTSTKFAVGGQGKELYFVDNGQYKKAQIQ